MDNKNSKIRTLFLWNINTDMSFYKCFFFFFFFLLFLVFFKHFYKYWVKVKSSITVFLTKIRNQVLWHAPGSIGKITEWSCGEPSDNTCQTLWCHNTLKLSTNKIAQQRSLLYDGQTRNEPGKADVAFYNPVLSLNIKSETRSFKSNENIHKKEGGSYYVVSANKASSVTL